MAQRRHLTALALALAAGVAAAQEGPGYRIVLAETPPRDAVAAEAQAVARSAGAETDMTYATVVRGDLSDNAAIEPLDTRRDTGSPPSFGGVGVLAVLLALMAMLVAFLRFGGGGSLLARSPGPAAQAPMAAPESWNLRDADQELPPDSLLAQIAAMPDRRAALVRLLHHCLLRAGSESQTRFARADTERQAFRRVPGQWRQHAALSDLLVQAELAHYGGREVDGEAFARMIAAGRAMLLAPGGRRHA